MRRVLLDTSAYSVLRRGHALVQGVVETADVILVNPVVLGELHAGFRQGSRRSENERILRRFLDSPRVQTVPMTEETASCYAHIVTFLREAGTPIPVNDIWIAASAMEYGSAVLTTDSHYRQVRQIRVEHFEP